MSKRYTRRVLLITLWGLLFTGVFMPELMEATNRVISKYTHSPFPPVNAEKAVTSGISRDFYDLRKSLAAQTRNGLSRPLFYTVYLLFTVIPLILAMDFFIVSKKFRFCK